uniref:Protein S100-A9 n=1 Tax=Equus caballus TaxID=9796 RepID=F6T046_HORSE
MKQSSCKRAEYPSQGRPINAGPAPRSPTLCVALGLDRVQKNGGTVPDGARLGHPDTLNRKEFKQLVQKELANFLKSKKKDEKAINHIMEDLDTNEDKQLSFEEFIILVARLTHASHEKMHEHDQGHGHCHGPGLGESGHGHSHGGHGHSHGGHGHSH